MLSDIINRKRRRKRKRAIEKERGATRVFWSADFSAHIGSATMLAEVAGTRFGQRAFVFASLLNCIRTVLFTSSSWHTFFNTFFKAVALKRGLTHLAKHLAAHTEESICHGEQRKMLLRTPSQASPISNKQWVQP